MFVLSDTQQAYAVMIELIQNSPQNVHIIV